MAFHRPIKVLKMLKRKKKKKEALFHCFSFLCPLFSQVEPCDLFLIHTELIPTFIIKALGINKMERMKEKRTALSGQTIPHHLPIFRSNVKKKSCSHCNKTIKLYLYIFQLNTQKCSTYVIYYILSSLCMQIFPAANCKIPCRKCARDIAHANFSL